MKKLLYILSLVLMCSACSLNEFEPETSKGDASDKVKLSLSVSVPEAATVTKAMDQSPQLKTMHLVVFDKNGFLVEYAEASRLEKATNNDTEYSFDVELTMSEEPRFIHFVGNCPETPRFGNEAEVMTKLITSGESDAYWCRKEIKQISSDNKTAPFTANSLTLNEFGVIPLTRNFAKIVVSSNTGDLTDISYAVVGAPTKGTVVAYNRNARDFQEYAGKSWNDLNTAQYEAFMPVDADFDFTLEESDFKNSPVYVYERDIPTQKNPAYVIVKGRYSDGNYYYYKVDLRDGEGNYLPIRRNFQYTITISSVTRAGKASFEEAQNGPGTGDISSATEYESLTNISDGDVRLFVEYTSRTLVSSGPVTLKAKLAMVSGRNVTLNSLTAYKNEDAGVTGEAIGNVTENPSGSLGDWQTITITPLSLGDAAKTQSITVKGTYTVGSETKTIFRKVDFTLMRKLYISAQCVPSEVAREKGKLFNVDIIIPSALGESMFPLDFDIEAVSLSIAPKGDNMPVKSGISTILTHDGISAEASARLGKSSFWFVKTLTFEEYEALPEKNGTKTFSAAFQTNKAVSATEIYVSNEYFNQAKCALGNYDESYFRNLKFENAKNGVYPDEEDTPVTFSFNTELHDNLSSTGGIRVILTGLYPAEDETQLTHVSGNEYVMDFGNGGEKRTLKLLTLAEGTEDVKVELSAQRFRSASASAARNGITYNFLDPKFSPGNNWKNKIQTGVGKTTTLTFSLNKDYSPQSIRMELNGIKPADMTRFVYEGDGVYTYTPASGQNQTINFVTTEKSGNVTVKMTADRYNETTVTGQRRL